MIWILDLVVGLISTALGLLMLIGTANTYKPEDLPVLGIAVVLMYMGFRMTQKARH